MAKRKVVGLPGKMPSEFKIYTFKVYLGRKRLKRPRAPWRVVEIRGDQTLVDLHSVIFEAFDRFDEHLYSFYIGDREFALLPPEELSPVGLVNRPFSDDESASAERAAIGDLGLSVGDWFTYLFDYGDEWWHVVELVKIEERQESDANYPRVVEKRGQSPPQYPEPEEE